MFLHMVKTFAYFLLSIDSIVNQKHTPTIVIHATYPHRCIMSRRRPYIVGIDIGVLLQRAATTTPCNAETSIMKSRVNAHSDRPYKRIKILFLQVRQGCGRHNMSELYAPTSIIQIPEAGNRSPGPPVEPQPSALVVESDGADRSLVDDPVCDACVHSPSSLDRRRC
jgi:hypothetical protein